MRNPLGTPTARCLHAAILIACTLLAGGATAKDKDRCERAGTIVRDLKGLHGPETYEWVNGKGRKLRRKELSSGLSANTREPLTLKVQNVNTLKYSVAASTQQYELFVQADGFLKNISGVTGTGNAFTANAPAPDLADKKLGKAGMALAAAKLSELAVTITPFSRSTRDYAASVGKLLAMRGIDAALLAAIPDTKEVEPDSVHTAVTWAVERSLGRKPTANMTYSQGEIVSEGGKRYDEAVAHYEKIDDEFRDELKKLGDAHEEAVKKAKAERAEADKEALKRLDEAKAGAQTKYDKELDEAKTNRDARIKRAEACRDKPKQHEQAIRDLIELYRKETTSAVLKRNAAIKAAEQDYDKAAEANVDAQKEAVAAADKKLADGKAKTDADYKAFADFHKALLTEYASKLAPLFANADANYQVIEGNTFEVYFQPTFIRGDNLKFFVEIVPLDATAAKDAQDTVSKEPIASVTSIDDVKVEYSTGLMLHNLVTTSYNTSPLDQNGHLLPPTTVVDSSGVVSTVPSLRIVRDPQDTLQVAFSAFAHVYKRNRMHVQPGISFGVGLREALSSPIIAIGPSLIFGERQRGILTYGLAFGRVKRLTNFSVNQVLPQNTPGLVSPPASSDRFVFGHFISLTFNL